MESVFAVFLIVASIVFPIVVCSSLNSIAKSLETLVEHFAPEKTSNDSKEE